MIRESKRLTKKKVIQMIVGLLLLSAFFGKTFFAKDPVIVGGTMGTSYRVTINGWVSRPALKNLTDEITAELIEVNRQMSTWDANSEISKFNATSNQLPFSVSKQFSKVVCSALSLSKSTQGAFDPTLNPLLNLWGFGSEGDREGVPSDLEIIQTKKITGWSKLSCSEEKSTLQKESGLLQLDLGAIAKGHGVDRVGHGLTRKGYKDWFVEVGGEVLVLGNNSDDVPWRIGIQYPSTNPAVQKYHCVLNLSSNAVATSGDYRNYVVRDEILYSHILDPRSGRSVLSDTASVTVVAPTCMDADGLATALFVMGPEDGLLLVEALASVEALFLVRESNEKISEKFSSGFKAVTRYTPANF